MQEISRRSLGLGLALAVTGCVTGAARESVPALDQRLGLLSRFVGSWRGAAEGEPGSGTVTRSYAPILQGRFIEERNESRYQSGEVHHHLGYWSFDRARARVILRQFHVEGFVNTFVAATPDFADDTLMLETEAIENIPPGFRARETYRFAGADAFEEVFEIAPPNAGFARYSLNRFERV